MSEKIYMLNPLSDYIEAQEDWELVEYYSRYIATDKWLLTEASHTTKREIERVWKSRYPREPIPILECVPPLHTMSSIESYLKELEEESTSE